MEHYWGVKTIMHRMDINSPKTLYRYIRKLALPAYLRVNPKRPTSRILYSNSELMMAWEMAMSSTHRERLLALEDDRTPERLLSPTTAEKIAARKRDAA